MQVRPAPPVAGALAAVLAVTLTSCTPVARTPTSPAPPTATGPAPTTAGSTPTASATTPGDLTLGADGRPFTVSEVARFQAPWAMAFLPGSADALVTQRSGTLLLVDTTTGDAREVGGVPRVRAAGQGGLGDIVLGPTFATDHTVYLSWVESGEGGSGAVVGRARLVTGEAPRLEGLTTIWTQTPKVAGDGHFSHRLAFSPDGATLFVTSGERQKFTPAQDMGVTLGKIMRMRPDGSDAQIWTSGHRNPLGIAFAPDGNLWSTEMGPQGGDELNLIVQGGNYGWPEASNGSHYGGGPIPDHAPGDGFEPPKVYWTPSVSPGSLMIYDGDAFAPWQGDAFIGALSGEALIHVDLDGTNAVEADHWDMGDRIREVEQGPDGTIWLLTDGGAGRLLHLTPVS